MGGRSFLKVNFFIESGLNSKFNSKQNPKYSFKKYSFDWVREILYNYSFKRLWGKSFNSRLKKRPKNYSPRIRLDTQKLVGMIRNNCNSWGSWSFPAIDKVDEILYISLLVSTCLQVSKQQRCWDGSGDSKISFKVRWKGGA